MNKFRKATRAMRLILQKPYLLNLVLDDNDNWKKQILKKHPGFQKLPSLPLMELIGIGEITVNPYSFLEGGSLVTDLALLKGLAAKIPGCKYFEIGTWRGESVANVSSVAELCYTIDLPKEEKIKLGFPEEYIRQYAMYSKELKNINHLEINTLYFDFTSLNQKFDLVFIDGDHHYQGVLNDTLKVFEHLVGENTIVVWHDYGFSPKETRFEVLSAILDGIRPELRSNLYQVQNTMCAVYLPQKPIIRYGDEPIYTVKVQASDKISDPFC